MASTGINYFVNALGIDPNSFKIYYDFNQSGAFIPSMVSGNNVYSGILSSEGSFWQESGSGFFTGQSISISNANTGLNSGAWTMLFVYEKTGVGNGVLFSNYKTGIVNGYSGYQGFVIGINDANRLYFESYDNSGPYIRTFDTLLGSKNAVAVSYINNVLSFSYYDFSHQQLENETFVINGTYLFNSEEWYLGSAVNAPIFFSGNNFLGYIDEYLYFNQSLQLTSLSQLFNGFFSTKNADILVETVYSREENSLVPTVLYRNEVLGHQAVLGGNLIDRCGNVTPIYVDQDITGLVPYTGMVSTTTTGTYTITGYEDGGFTTNTGFMESFGMDGVVYLKSITSGDFNELYVRKNIYENLNDEGSFNGVENKFQLPINVENSSLNIYVNGLAQLGSGYAITGNLYNSGILLSGDFYLNGNLIESTGKYTIDDSLIYDSFSGARLSNTGFFHDGSVEQIISNGSGNYWYFNGYKLILNQDYYETGVDIVLLSGQVLLSGTTGTLFSAPFDLYNNYYTGLFASQMTSKQSRTDSELYLNRVRQWLENDYIEISNVDLLTGSGIFDLSLDNLYNNNPFWQGNTIFDYLHEENVKFYVQSQNLSWWDITPTEDGWILPSGVTYSGTTIYTDQIINPGQTYGFLFPTKIVRLNINVNKQYELTEMPRTFGLTNYSSVRAFGYGYSPVFKSSAVQGLRMVIDNSGNLISEDY